MILFGLCYTYVLDSGRLDAYMNRVDQLRIIFKFVQNSVTEKNLT
jgi:hypothetical protein